MSPDLVGKLPKLSLWDLTANVGKHQVSASEIDDQFKHNAAWVLLRAERLRRPVRTGILPGPSSG